MCDGFSGQFCSFFKIIFLLLLPYLTLCKMWRLYDPRHEKTNILVFDMVRHKPGCTATKDG